MMAMKLFGLCCLCWLTVGCVLRPHAVSDPWRGVQRFELRGVKTIDERDGQRSSACVVKGRIRDVKNKGWILVCE